MFLALGNYAVACFRRPRTRKRFNEVLGKCGRYKEE